MNVQRCPTCGQRDTIQIYKLRHTGGEIQTGHDCLTCGEEFIVVDGQITYVLSVACRVYDEDARGDIS